MIKVGITGGIGSGKSTVCTLFKMLHVPVYNADIEARALTNNDAKIVAGVKGLFGEDIYQDGQLNRAKVGSLVFNNTELLSKLNTIIHPVVANHFKNWLIKHQYCPLIIKEAAILFESDGHKQMDKVITVSAPEALRINRVMKRDALTKEEVESRIRNQMSEEEKVKMSDYVIYCNDVELLIPQVVDLHKELKSLS